jgi:hypothetical protein
VYWTRTSSGSYSQSSVTCLYGPNCVVENFSTKTSTTEQVLCPTAANTPFWALPTQLFVNGYDGVKWNDVWRFDPCASGPSPTGWGGFYEETFQIWYTQKVQRRFSCLQVDKVDAMTNLAFQVIPMHHATLG